MSRDVLVVGINAYQYLPNLNASACDAESVANCLAQFGEARVLRLPEVIQAQKPVVSHQASVTTRMLEDALIRLFKPSGKNIPHTAIFYFSGHGLQRQAGIREGYLATSDANPEAGNYGLSLHWLRRLLEASPVQQRVVILDCCHSGELLNYLEADPGARDGTDRLFMAASREYEAAYEALTGGHSVFTQALLTGLNPRTVEGGVVNSHRLTDRVNQRLKGELQQPLFESSGSEIILTRAPSPNLTVATAPTSTVEHLKQLCGNFCPFPGLEPLSEHHADFFFGRQDLTATLVQQVITGSVCAVVGASGVGKTSLLQAGLMAQLRRHQPAAATTCLQLEVQYLNPGQTPLKRLAEVFIDSQVQGLQRAEQLRQAESFLQQGETGLTQLLAGLTNGPDPAASPRQLVLVVDHLEELFPPQPSPQLVQARQQFLDCLWAGATNPAVPLKLVLGIRSDHLEQLRPFPALADLVQHQGLQVPPLTYDQLKAALIGPLDKLGLTYDPNLIYTLVLDLVGATGELALLQFVMRALWSHRHRHPGQNPALNLDSYTELGGLRQLLRQWATQVYDALEPEEQHAARRIFLSLCEVKDGAAPTSRRGRWSELITPTLSASLLDCTLNKLARAHLIVVDGDSPVWPGDGETPTAGSGSGRRIAAAGDGRTVSLGANFQISHESLVRSWPLLQAWLVAEGEILGRQRLIEKAAWEWQQWGCPDHADYLLTGQRLVAALEFQHRHPEHLSSLARDYLGVSEQLTRRQHRQRLVMKLLVPLSMVAGMLTAYGYEQIQQLQLPLLDAHSRQGAAVGTEVEAELPPMRLWPWSD